MVRKAIGICLTLALGLWSMTMTAQEQGKPQPRETPWYPLKAGNKWTYRSVNLDAVRNKKNPKARNEDPSQKVEISVDKLIYLDIPKGDNKTQKQPVWRLVGKSEDRELVQHIAVLPDGVYRYAGGDKDITAPLRILQLPAAAGDSWSWNFTLETKPIKGTFTVKEDDTVVVPAGKFKTLRVSGKDIVIGTQKMSIDTWFHEGTGIVKQETTYGTFTVLLELEKFEEGK